MAQGNDKSSNGQESSIGTVKPSYGISVVPLGDLAGEGTDTHESFKIDRYDNSYGGHTTVRDKDKKVSINWNE